MLVGRRSLAAAQPADATAPADAAAADEIKMLREANGVMRARLASLEVRLARWSHETGSLSSEAAAANMTPSSGRRSSLLEDGPGGSQDSKTPIQPQRLVNLTTPDTSVPIDAGASASATAAAIAAAGVQA